MRHKPHRRMSPIQWGLMKAPNNLDSYAGPANIAEVVMLIAREQPTKVRSERGDRLLES